MKELKKDKQFIIVYAVIVAIRLFLFIFDLSEVYLTPDLYEYININGFDIFSLSLDEFRTFGYPLFIEIFERLFPAPYNFVGFAQLLISLVSIPFFYKTLKLISDIKPLCLVGTIIYSLSYVVYGWDNTMLSESLALSITVIIIYLLVSYMKAPKVSGIVAVAALLFVGISLKPSCLYMLIIVFGYLFVMTLFNKECRKIHLKSFAIMLIPVLLVVGYASLFNAQYGKFTLSNTTRRQQLTIILWDDYKLYKNGNDAEIITYIDEFERDSSIEPDEQISAINLSLLSEFDGKRIDSFINSVRFGNSSNLIAYIKAIANNVWAELDVEFYSYFSAGIFSSLIYAISKLFGLTITFCQGMVIGGLCALAFLDVLLFKKKFDWLKFGIFAFIAGAYALTIFGTNAEYGRTALISLPFMYIAIIQFCDFAFHKITAYMNNIKSDN